MGSAMQVDVQMPVPMQMQSQTPVPTLSPAFGMGMGMQHAYAQQPQQQQSQEECLSWLDAALRAESMSPSRHLLPIPHARLPHTYSLSRSEYLGVIIAIILLGCVSILVVFLAIVSVVAGIAVPAVPAVTRGVHAVLRPFCSSFSRTYCCRCPCCGCFARSCASVCV